MMIAIGREYLYTGDHPEYKHKIVSVQDTNAIGRTAKISIPDVNGLCWDWAWVDFDYLKELES